MALQNQSMSHRSFHDDKFHRGDPKNFKATMRQKHGL